MNIFFRKHRCINEVSGWICFLKLNITLCDAFFALLLPISFCHKLSAFRRKKTILKNLFGLTNFTCSMSWGGILYLCISAWSLLLGSIKPTVFFHSMDLLPGFKTKPNNYVKSLFQKMYFQSMDMDNLPFSVYLSPLQTPPLLNDGYFMLAQF